MYLRTLILGRRTRRRTPEPCAESENAWKALVTPAQWRAAQSTQTVVRNGRMVLGVAGAGPAVLRMRRADANVRSKNGRAYYGCRRKTGTTGTCPAPTNVSATASDEYVDKLMEEACGTEFLAAPSSQRTRPGRRPPRMVEARDYRKAWNRVQGTIADDEWREERAVREAAEAQALAHDQDLQHHAADAEDIPHDADAWHALDVAHQRRIASAVFRVVVAHPATRLRYADITDRGSRRPGPAGSSVAPGGSASPWAGLRRRPVRGTDPSTRRRVAAESWRGARRRFGHGGGALPVRGRWLAHVGVGLVISCHKPPRLAAAACR